jgi:RNA 2',3'-cyclic 3'-phosphodiesterase
MARIRTFIAVELSKAIRQRIAVLKGQLGLAAEHVKWVEPDNLHLTLFFLGEVDEREIPSVCSAVGEGVSSSCPFEMSIERVGCFPNNYRPRIIWIGVGHGAKELCDLHQQIEPRLLELGCYRREDRKFTPHVTCGRLRSERLQQALVKEMAKYGDWQGGQTLVQELLIMRSELTPQGPSYCVLGRVRLP